MKKIVLTALALSLGSGAAALAAEIRVTFTNGAERTVASLPMENGFVVLPEGRVDRAKVAAVWFEKGVLSVAECRTLFLNGDSRSVAEGLAPYQADLRAASSFQGNGRELLEWLLRASFWSGRYTETAALAADLQKTAPDAFPAASGYEALALVELGRTAEAESLLQSLQNSSGDVAAMAACGRALIAFRAGKEDAALQELAGVYLAGSRSFEWEPAALALEAMIYRKTGRADAAAGTEKQLKLGWPGSVPVFQGVELN